MTAQEQATKCWNELEHTRLVDFDDCTVNIEEQIALITTALQQREREVWEAAIQAGVDEAYALAPSHSGKEQLAVRMILEAIRGARQRAKEVKQ